MKRRLLVLALCSFALASACGGDSTAPEITVNGSWSGQLSGGGTMSLVLAQTGSSVTGTGQITGSSSVALTVTGTYVKPTISLTLASSGFSSSNFLSNAVSATSMTGTINGSGFTNEAITLTRH